MVKLKDQLSILGLLLVEVTLSCGAGNGFVVRLLSGVCLPQGIVCSRAFNRKNFIND